MAAGALSEVLQVPALLMEEALVALTLVVQTAAAQELERLYMALAQDPVSVGGPRGV